MAAMLLICYVIEINNMILYQLLLNTNSSCLYKDAVIVLGDYSLTYCKNDSLSLRSPLPVATTSDASDR